MMNMFKDAVKMQSDYKRLRNTGNLSKRAMCDICTPFRDKYQLTDLQTLRIAREELSLSELVELAERYDPTK